MMRISNQKSQSAQGMVEFALVLPILLFLIFGIFAVGHLIFTYAFVLSASREAARYGAATGSTTDGKIFYRDCDGIRRTATRVGGVAGVQAGNVNITYDAGPETSTKGNCPIGGTGPTVNLGDRVFVEILLPYKPIVPIVNFPSFTMRANTARTIIKSVSVGDSPDAENLCQVTTTTLTTSPRPSVVGEFVTFTVNVVPKSGAAPTAADSVTIVDIDENVICTFGITNGSGNCRAAIYTADTHYFTARYAGSMGTECYLPSEAFDFQHRVIMSSTITDIVSTSPNPSLNRDQVVVTVDVYAAYPGGGIPTGRVNVTGGGSSCNLTLDASGRGSCTIRPSAPATGHNITIRADYVGDDNYEASYDYATHAVNDPTPTYIFTPTPGAATATPAPESCPVLTEDMNFLVQTDAFYIGVRNPNPSLSVSVTSFRLEWPVLPTAKLQQARFATDSSVDCTNQNDICMWHTNPGIDPPSAAISSTDKTKWNDTAGLLAAGQTKELRLVFGDPLPNGAYRLTVNFSNGCSLNLEGTRNLTNQ